jgi:lipoprotein-anchoring transpeptidase ErfK/SrfK
MAASALDMDWKKFLKFLSAAFAGLLALPGLVRAQASKISGDWLQLTPSDSKAPIPTTSSVTTSEDTGTTTVSINRRSRYRSRADSVAGAMAYERSKRDQNLHIVVSLEERRLWVVVGTDTVMDAPVAIGSGQTLTFGEKSWQFDTPRGVRTIRGKDADPNWIPPEWHYAETAKEYGLKVANLSMNKPQAISGGRTIMFQDGEAGVMHPDSGFALLPLEEEIVFDNTLFVPPIGSKNRKVQGMLGKYKLDMGAGVLLHGTPFQNSIGTAATHGCLRLRDADIEWLHDYVPVGTKVYIY